MIDAITVKNAHLYGDALASQFRLRHRVFVEREGYDVPNFDGMEFDQFDTPACTYLVRRDPQGEARAVARLIPTTTPYMIETLWPDLLDGKAPPKTATVWEATRFCCDHTLPPQTRDRYLGELIAGCLEYGMHAGISDYLCVTSAPILRRTLMRAGCEVEFLGKPSSISTFPVVAGRIIITQASIEQVRLNRKLEGPVLNLPPQVAARDAA